TRRLAHRAPQLALTNMWWGRNPGVWWGGVLVIIGALFLLANLGVLNNLDWNVIWPLVLIAVGVWMLLARIGPGSVYADVDSAEAREGLAKAKLELAVGSAQVDVRASSLEGDQLYKVHIEHGGTSPKVELDRATGTLRISQRPDWFTGARRLRADGARDDGIGSRSWKSDGFDAAKDRYEITVSGGALSIELGVR